MFCWPALCILNCYKENVIIFVIVSLIFHDVRVFKWWNRKFLGSHSVQSVYIKVKTLCNNTVPIIHASLKEVCGNATLDRSTVQLWHKHFNPPVTISLSDRPSHFFSIRFLTRSASDHTTVSLTVFLYAFISFTFQVWIRYRSFCSGRTLGALVKTMKK